jgi:hypothetical protein
MNEFFRFLVQNELFIYALLGVAALFAFRSAFSAWVEWRKAVFGLEKEMAYGRLRAAGVLFLLFAMLGLSAFCLVAFVVPFLPANSIMATATADLLFTPLPSLPAGTPQVTGPVTPEGTTGCIPDQLLISSLQAGQEISGKVVLVGTVNISNFGFYKYEFTPLGGDSWVTIQAGNVIRKDEELGVWDVSELTPGEYQLRLVATDNQGAELEPCVIPVRVTSQ